MCIWVSFLDQETAYEMRISDWSSDLCSSVLLDAADAPVEPGDRAELLQSAEDASRSSGRAAGAGVRTERFCREVQTLQVPSGEQQIGRASCRGRVGPYV